MKPQDALAHLLDEVDGLTTALVESAESLEKALARMEEIRADLTQLLTLDRVPERAFEDLVGEIEEHFEIAASAAVCGVEDVEQNIDKALYALKGAVKGQYSCWIGDVLYQVFDPRVHTWIAQKVGEAAVAASTVDGLVGLVRHRHDAKPDEAVTPAELLARIEHARPPFSEADRDAFARAWVKENPNHRMTLDDYYTAAITINSGDRERACTMTKQWVDLGYRLQVSA
jgi:hypothetical protein